MNGSNQNIWDPFAFLSSWPTSSVNKSAYTINSTSSQKLQVFFITEHQSRLQGMWICAESDILALKKHFIARNKEASKNISILQGNFTSSM